jgi:hypothetical protein
MSTTSQSQTMQISCTAPDRFTGGLPLCQEFLDLVSSADEEVGDALSMAEAERVSCDDARMLPGPWRNDPTVPVVVSFAGVTLQCINGPPEAEFGLAADFAAEQALFLGVLCERGEAYVDPTDPTLFGCEDNEDGETLRIHGLIPVAQEPDEINHHPSLDAAELLFDGNPWEPVDPSVPPPDEDCEAFADDETVFVVDPLEHTIELRYDPGQRERGPDGELETLELSIYSTRPELERRFTLFEPDTPLVQLASGEDALVATLTWDPPSLPRDRDAVPPLPESVLVRFYLTVLDQRGGFDIATRAVCLR